MEMQMELDRMIQGKIPNLISFSTTTCTLCDLLSKILGDLKEDMGEGINITEIDIDKEKATTINFDSMYQIMGVPTMLLFKEGKLVWKHSGVMFKDDLIKKITPFLEEPELQEL